MAFPISCDMDLQGNNFSCVPMIIKQKKWGIHPCFEVITMFSMPKPELGYPNDGRSLDGQIELQ